MSFLGGAECSTAGNPLSQFSKLGSDDKSLQRDRLVGQGPANLQGMRSNGLGMSGSQDAVSLLFQEDGGGGGEMDLEWEVADGEYR
jgi:peroxin-5